MKVNKTISIDLKILNEMVSFCKKKDMSFSGLVVAMWEAYKKVYN
ncbi:MAG: hypothetical protein ACRCX2_37750 [Paraclostridium sp.]